MSLEEKRLFHACLNFVEENTVAVLQSPSFQRLSLSALCTILDSSDLTVESEFQLYESVKQWASFIIQPNASADDVDVEELKEALKEPISRLRFNVMSAHELRQVRSDSLVDEGTVMDAIFFQADPAGALGAIAGSGGVAAAIAVTRNPLHYQARGRYRFSFDPIFCSPTAVVGENHEVHKAGNGAAQSQTVRFASDGFVLGDTAIPSQRRTYWEVTAWHGLASAGIGNPYVGIARRETIDLGSNLGDGGGICWRPIGATADCWRERVSTGLYGDGVPIRDGGVIGVLVDLRPSVGSSGSSASGQTLSFYRDGEPLGVAFTDLDPTAVYYPCCGNATGSMNIRTGLSCPLESEYE
eukprot:SAG31_NODE_3739_length_3932_cov_3.343245_5_plen_355_part_00